MMINSRDDGRAARAVNILVTCPVIRCGAGILLDGGFRHEVRIGRLSIPADHCRPSSLTSLTLHEEIEINGPIRCGDAQVFPGNMIMGDVGCVFVTPVEIADEIALRCGREGGLRRFLGGKRKKCGVISCLYPANDAGHLSAVAEWRKAQRW